MSDINEYLIENGKCCACDAPLKDSGHVNMVMLTKKAPWKYPIWGNLLAEKETAMGYALGMVCDECVDDEKGKIKKPIKYAVEVQGGEPVEGSLLSDKIFTKRFILYHDAHALEDGEPTMKVDIAEKMAADLERDEMFTATKMVFPDDVGAMRLDAEFINEKMLSQSAYYFMLINKSYVNALKDPTNSQHHDLLRQLEVAAKMKKPTVIVYDETVTQEDREYLGHMMGNLDVRAVMTHNFREGYEDQDLSDKVGELLKTLRRKRNGRRKGNHGGLP